MSVEDLWSTIWGKVVSKICNEIFYNGGIEAYEITTALSQQISRAFFYV
jgi:phosphoribosylformylglycinamidine (FGAM) synthase PurS component